MLRDLHHALETYEQALVHTNDEYGALEALSSLVRELLNERTNVQALALARLMRDRPNVAVTITRRPFDLPEGYWLVVFDSDPRFECGIAPNGDVSS